MLREIAVLGPLSSHVQTAAFLGCEVWDGAPRPHRPVVVVWLDEAVTEDPKAMERLKEDTRLAILLDHPGVTKVHGLFSFEEGWARVVEFVDGEPLAAVAPRLRSQLGGDLPPGWVARFGIDVAEALHHAHQSGRAFAGRPLVHGGIRPDTLFVGFDGRTRVSGYGAQALAGFRPDSGAFDARCYMAPEQILRGPDRATVATDVYMLSAVLHQMARGLPPHAHSGDLEQAILTGDLPRLPGPFDRLEPLLRSGLAREAHDRPQDLDVFACELRSALGGELVDRRAVHQTLQMLFPEDGATRQARRSLLESAADPDVVTLLSLPHGSDAVAAPGYGPSAGSPSVEVQAPPRSVSEEPLAVQEDGDLPSGPRSEAPAQDLSPSHSAPSRQLDLGEEPLDRFDVDGSRWTGWLVVATVAAILVALFFGLPSSERSELTVEPEPVPRELIEAALNRKRPKNVLDPQQVSPDLATRSVRMASNPPVDVYWGSERLGRTPLEVRLPRARVELRLTDAGQRINVYRVFDIRDVAEVKVELEPARLRLDAPGGSEVYLNGTRLGRAPMEFLELYEGDYVIEVRHDGRRFKRMLKAEPGAELAVKVEL